jgi:hypothetical protein
LSTVTSVGNKRNLDHTRARPSRWLAAVRPRPPTSNVHRRLSQRQVGDDSKSDYDGASDDRCATLEQDDPVSVRLTMTTPRDAVPSGISGARRSRCRCNRSIILGLFICHLLLGPLDLASALVKELHYGRDGGLDIECGPDELILIESERLAFNVQSAAGGVGRGSSSAGGASGSGNVGRCRADSASCSVPYSQASWYCRGKSSCSGMPVERRPLHKRTCGSEFTNCLRVEYQCVKSE